jgi:hypothetical protein
VLTIKMEVGYAVPKMIAVTKEQLAAQTFLAETSRLELLAGWPPGCLW